MLEKIGYWIVKNKIGIIILFIGLLLLAFYGMSDLKINYDMYSYLPQHLQSVQGQKTLKSEFGLSDSVYVIVSNKTISETNKILEKIKSLPDVKETFWYSDLEDVKIPKEFASEIAKDKFIAGKDTLIQVKLAQTGRKVSKQAEAIKAVIGVDGHVVGDYLYNLEIEKLSNSAKSSMLVVALIVILLVLIFALTQPAYSVLFLVSAGFAILLNFGLTSFVRGEISFITSSIAAALQLAVTMDYAIFLLHRYEEEKRNRDHGDAMAKAIAKTSVSVFGSAMTTVAGFLALLFMSLGVGADMGKVMAQGVAIGFIMTLTLLPAMILVLEKPLDKLKHRSFFPNMTPLANKIVKYKYLIAVIFIVLLIPAAIGAQTQKVTYSFSEGIKLSPEVQADIDLVSQKFGGGNQVILICDNIPLEERLGIEKKLNQISWVTSVEGPMNTGTVYIPNSYIPKKILDKLEQNGKNLIFMSIDAPNSTELDKSYIELSKLEKEYDGKITATGSDVLQHEVGKLGEKDSVKVTIATILGVWIVVFFCLRRFGISVLLIAAIQGAVWINIGMLWYLNANPMFFFAPIALGAIQLGSTVDYSILLTTRYEEEKKNKPIQEAMIISIKEGAPAIITSALTLFGACMAIAIISEITMVKDMTMLLSRGSLISMVVVIFAVPALLLSYDRLIEKFRRRKNA
jgi:hypothetical protein